MRRVRPWEQAVGVQGRRRAIPREQAVGVQGRRRAIPRRAGMQPLLQGQAACRHMCRKPPATWLMARARRLHAKAHRRLERREERKVRACGEAPGGVKDAVDEHGRSLWRITTTARATMTRQARCAREKEGFKV